MKQLYFKTAILKKSQLIALVDTINGNQLINLQDKKPSYTNIFLDENLEEGPPGRTPGPESY